MAALDQASQHARRTALLDEPARHLRSRERKGDWSDAPGGSRSRGRKAMSRAPRLKLHYATVARHPGVVGAALVSEGAMGQNDQSATSNN